jgi:hypothetical protein
MGALRNIHALFEAFLAGKAHETCIKHFNSLSNQASYVVIGMGNINRIFRGRV